jgi:hypothetical protein
MPIRAVMAATLIAAAVAALVSGLNAPSLADPIVAYELRR